MAHDTSVRTPDGDNRQQSAPGRALAHGADLPAAAASALSPRGEQRTGAAGSWVKKRIRKGRKGGPGFVRGGGRPHGACAEPRQAPGVRRHLFATAPPPPGLGGSGRACRPPPCVRHKAGCWQARHHMGDVSVDVDVRNRWSGRSTAGRANDDQHRCRRLSPTQRAPPAAGPVGEPS